MQNDESWSDETWIAFIEKARNSGNIKEYCAKHSINPSLYRKHFHRLKRKRPEWQKHPVRFRWNKVPATGAKILTTLWQQELEANSSRVAVSSKADRSNIEILSALFKSLPGVTNCHTADKGLLRADLDKPHADALGCVYIVVIDLESVPDDDLKAVAANFLNRVVRNCKLGIIACSVRQKPLIANFISAVKRSGKVVCVTDQDLDRILAGACPLTAFCRFLSI